MDHAMNTKTWVKTKDLINETFHVVDVAKRSYRQWDTVNNTFKFSDTPEQGFAPFWNITLESGTWSASPGQYGQLLLAAEDKGMSDILGRTFRCKSNGMPGKDIRYFFDLVTK